MRSFILPSESLILKFRSGIHRYHLEYLHGMFDPVVVGLDMQTPFAGCWDYFGTYTTLSTPVVIDILLYLPGYPSASSTRRSYDAPSHHPPQTGSIRGYPPKDRV